MGEKPKVLVARAVVYGLAIAVIAAAVGLIALPWFLQAVCTPDGFFACGDAPGWRAYLPAAAIPFAILAILLVRRSVRAADVWVTGLVLVAFGGLALLAVPLFYVG